MMLKNIFASYYFSYYCGILLYDTEIRYNVDYSLDIRMFPSMRCGKCQRRKGLSSSGWNRKCVNSLLPITFINTFFKHSISQNIKAVPSCTEKISFSSFQDSVTSDFEIQRAKLLLCSKET